MLDKQLNLLLKFSRGVNQKKIHDLSIEEARKSAGAIALQMGLLPIDTIKTHDYYTKTKDGHNLHLRSYNIDESKKPILVFYHGGGYAIYNIETHDSFCLFLANSLNVVVVSMNYRRAPEYKYPTAKNDAILGTQWVINNYNLFNGDLENIILCGDSIGGSLALLVNKALYKDISIKGIVLLYPVITFKKHYSSYIKYGKDYFLDTKTMDWFERMYTNSKKDLNYNFDLESLTQNKSFIYLAISEYDVLRDEAIEFKNHLESINADIKCRVFESMPHNFALMAGKIKGAKQALDTICYDLQKII